MPDRPTVAGTLCTCQTCIEVNHAGLLLSRQEWLLHTAAGEFKSQEGSSCRDPAIDDTSDLVTMAFNSALCNSPVQPMPLPAHPDSGHSTMESVMQSAERLHKTVYQFDTPPSLIPTGGDEATQTTSHTQHHAHPSYPTQYPSQASHPYAPKSNHTVDKNLRALDIIHRGIQETLRSVPLIPDRTTRISTVIFFLDPAESKAQEFSTKMSAITLKNPIVKRRKEQVASDLFLLRARIQGWKELYPDVGPKRYGTDHHYLKRAATAYPAVQVALFLGISCRVLFGMGRNGCDYIMKLLAIFANTLLGFSLDSKEDAQVNMIPASIAAVESQFDLEPQTTVYAVCPSCHSTYPPTLESATSQSPRYQAVCNNKQAPDSEECGEALLDGDVPVKTFEYRHLDDYIASLLCNPHLEKHLRPFCDRTLQSCKRPPATIFNDVSDGHFWRTFRGHDGKLFVDGGLEIRIALAFNVDHFFTEGSSLRGAKASCGVISAACLNLPPEIRYDTANMYVAGIIPGPSMPNQEQEGSYFRPVINDLGTSWTRGTHFTRTASFSEGCTARSAAVSLVVDFPAGRSATGTAAVTSHHFCTVCQCEHLSTLHRTDFENWINRDPLVLRRLAEQYPHLSQKEQEDIFKMTGVRSSEFWRLPYWNPVQQLTVDPMHCLFERLCHRYTRDILSLQPKDPKAKEPPVRAFFYNFRSPFVRFPEDDPAGDLVPLYEDTMVIDLSIEFPEYIGSANEDELRDVLQDVSTGWRQSVPLIHEMLMRPMDNSVDSRNTLVEALSAKQKNALVYICADLGLPFYDVEHTEKPVFATLLVSWRLSFPLGPPNAAPLNASDALDHLRDVISNTLKPSSIGSVPANYGDPKNGSMKADQWRTLWRLYIPLALITLWGQGSPIRAPNADSKTELLFNAMALSAAAAITCRRSITLEHANTYREMLRVHVNGLRKLFPHFQLPSHHMAFHLYDFFLLFGPSKSWWCFPFERLIGQLQRTPHNHRYGQLESTMLRAFVRGSKLRQWLFREDAPPAIQECKRLFQDTRDSFENRSGGDVFYHRACSEQLKSLLGVVSVDQTSHIYRRGISYSNRHHHGGNCLVLIEQADQPPFPASIEHIVDCNGAVYVAIRRLLPAPAGTPNPFSLFPHFEAGVFSSHLSSSLELFPCSMILGHFAMYRMTNDLAAVVSLIRD